MPEIVFTVKDDGAISHHIVGIPGEGCKPISAFIARDLAAAFGAQVTLDEDTDEMHQSRSSVENPERNAQYQ
jgi:hypothetical protein